MKANLECIQHKSTKEKLKKTEKKTKTKMKIKPAFAWCVQWILFATLATEQLSNVN